MEQFAVVIPYYNEASYIAETLASLLAQSHPVSQLILVDNASTDGSEMICRRILAKSRIPDVLYLRESRPGVIYALEHGARHVQTEFMAFADADTYYPPHYLASCARLFRTRRGRCVGVMAKDIYSQPNTWNSLTARWVFPILSKILPWHCFAGGAGQTFRTEAFRAAGGYSSAHWSYVLQDHEIVNRIHKLGPTVYHPDHWCIPSPRRGDRSDVSWTKAEQLLYFLTPAIGHDWFFHRFLARRFEERQMDQLKLREQTWGEPLPVAETSAAA